MMRVGTWLVILGALIVLVLFARVRAAEYSFLLIKEHKVLVRLTVDHNLACFSKTPTTNVYEDCTIYKQASLPQLTCTFPHKLPGKIACTRNDL